MVHFSAILAQKRRFESGFTMIELLVVATIIIILTTIGLISYGQALENGRNGRRKTDLETVRQALVLFKADNGYYPSATYATLGTALGTGYISTMPQDPKASGGYAYTYTPANCVTTRCQTFTLGATLEGSGGAYSITNP